MANYYYTGQGDSAIGPGSSGVSPSNGAGNFSICTAGVGTASPSLTPTAAVPGSGDVVYLDPTNAAPSNPPGSTVPGTPSNAGTSAAHWICINSSGVDGIFLADCSFSGLVECDGSGFCFYPNCNFFQLKLNDPACNVANPDGTATVDVVAGMVTVSDWISFNGGTMKLLTPGGPTDQARNVDPGKGNVKNGTNYAILGTALRGDMPAGGGTTNVLLV